ncbi:hypothetical protein [Sphingorhabdus contaminans]|uniref:Uncharacterized protein n=1 Tax=Sphingorhabdus contaminans TaxID=1343899 RepID=A0A553WH09_9SPHN|nr:hypothetical protein [Sphingorhabdus contaminans]TSB03976.1 hypothetical protein FOM92_00575 [Sphingorhabdus contaminans]
MNMNTKHYVQMLAKLNQDEVDEMAELLAGFTGKDKRDAGEEARLQDFINSLPEPPDNGRAEALKQARLSAGERCNGGYLPKRQLKDQTHD